MPRAFPAAMVLSAFVGFVGLAFAGDEDKPSLIATLDTAPADMPPATPRPVAPAPSRPAPATLPGLADDGPDGPAEHVVDDGPQAPEWYPFGLLQASGGVYLMKPYFSSNPAFHVVTGATPTAGVVQQSTPGFDYGLGAAPLVILSWPCDDGFSVRGRWWYFDQESRLTAISTPSVAAIVSAPVAGSSLNSNGCGHKPRKDKDHKDKDDDDDDDDGPDPIAQPLAVAQPDQFAFGSRLCVLVFDVEGAQAIDIDNWMLSFSVGGRYAHLGQSYDVWEASAGTALGWAHSGHSFDGGGPTISGEIMHPLWKTRLSLYGDVRGSVLYGEHRLHTFFDSMSPDGAAVETTTSQDGFLPVVELELGIQYTGDWGDWKPIVRTGLVSQTWFNAGNATGTGGSLGFLGLMTTAGFAF
jgi:hypothetical protein